MPSAGTRDQTVRVYLSPPDPERPHGSDVDLALQRDPRSRAPGCIFQAGSEVAVLLRDGALYLYYEGMSQLAGQSVTLLRDEAEGEERLPPDQLPCALCGRFAD